MVNHLKYMNLAPLEALARVRSWKRKKIIGIMLTLESDLVIMLKGRVSVREGAIMFIGEGNSSGLHITPIPTRTFSYNDTAWDGVASCMFRASAADRRKLNHSNVPRAARATPTNTTRKTRNKS
jgi:hypothetical protein